MSDQEQPARTLAVRASDAERERTATLLREHTAAGRLSPEELSERLDGAYAARTVGELEALVADLPAVADPAHALTRPARSPARERARRRVLHVAGQAAIVSAICVVIWLATGMAGSFWPTWVVLGMGIRLAFVAWNELGPAADGSGESRRGRGGAKPPAP